MAWDNLLRKRESSGEKDAAASTEIPAASSAETATSEAKRQNRRSKRVYISMPILIKYQRGGQAYEENTTTEAVNAHGGLLRVNVAPERGQTLAIVNLKSAAEAECRVMYVGHPENGKTKVGVEFVKPAEYFWHIAFPPDDWNSADFKDLVIDKPAGRPQKRA